MLPSDEATAPQAPTATPLDGVEAMADVELVALLVGAGGPSDRAQDVALRVLERVGGLEGLDRAGTALVERVRGVGPATARRLSASVEIGRRILRRAAGKRLDLCTPEAVAAAFAPRIGACDHEQMWVLSVDGRTRLKGARQVARGGRHGLVVTAREILAAALADAASAIILVHNHPSGSARPSEADVEMTRAVARAADIVGVPLLDHVVVIADGSYVSLLDEGVLG